MSETIDVADDRELTALMGRLSEYGGFSDPTQHERDCVAAVEAIDWLRGLLNGRDAFLAERDLFADFVASIQTPNEGEA